jgi:hypothetical protein
MRAPESEWRSGDEEPTRVATWALTAAMERMVSQSRVGFRDTAHN